MIARQYSLRTDLDADARLMLRVRGGDVSAFDELTKRYRAYLVAVATRLMGDDRHSEDLAQETLLRVYRARHHYLPTAKFSTWLHTIVLNVARNARRTRVRRKEFAASDSLSQERAEKLGTGRNDSPDKSVVRRELQEAVRNAVSQLSRRQKKAIHLFYFRGLNYADTAAAMESSPGAIRSLLRRGRVNMRERLCGREGQVD